MNHKEDLIAGRNAVIEALRAKKPIDKIFVLDGCQDGPIRTIVREAKKTDAILKFVDKERLNQLTNEHHQGVVAIVAAYEYGTIDDLFKRAEEKGEDPFFILLDGIEDPHNLGAIIRTANLAGAHGVIIPKHRAVGVTPVVAKSTVIEPEVVIGLPVLVIRPAVPFTVTLVTVPDPPPPVTGVVEMLVTRPFESTVTTGISVPEP